jgi:hypothetical protein
MRKFELLNKRRKFITIDLDESIIQKIKFLLKDEKKINRK